MSLLYQLIKGGSIHPPEYKCDVIYQSREGMFHQISNTEK